MSAYVITVAAVAASATGQFRYDCDVLPEEAGFTRDGTFDAERWIDDGWFYQDIRGYGEGWHNGQFDGYRQPLAKYAGTDRFAAEWVMQSNGSGAEVRWAAPAGISFSGSSEILYHFTIGRDRMQFYRDAWLPILQFSFDVQTPHRHRLELFGADWYAYLIDGKVVDAGRPEGPYPTEDSRLIWWAGYYLSEHQTWWDYMEWGPMDDPDFDCDDIRNLRVKCRNGRVKARVRSKLPEGAELHLTNSGDRRTLAVDDRGRARTKYKKQTGDHTVLLLDCPAISRDINCGE